MRLVVFMQLLLMGANAWVVVSNEGRITFLGGIDVDPTRTGMVASLRFQRRGVQKWKLSYDDIGPVGSLVSTFFIADDQNVNVLTVDQ